MIKSKLIFYIILLIGILFLLDVGIVIIAGKYENDNQFNFRLVRYNFDFNKYIKEHNITYNNPIGLNYKKKPIIIMGEGMAAGSFLEEQDTLAYILSEYTKRPVYNRAKGGHYIQHAILQVQSHIIDDIIKNSEYALIIIPSFIDSYRLKVYPGPKWNKTNLNDKYAYPVLEGDTSDNLKLRHQLFPFITSSALYKICEKSLIYIKPANDPIHMKNTYNHAIRLRDELKKINPEIKLIIISYFELPGSYKELEETKDVIFIYAKDIIDTTADENYDETIYQPKPIAWKKIVQYISAKFYL
jgi:hypothetical protein